MCPIVPTQMILIMQKDSGRVPAPSWIRPWSFYRTPRAVVILVLAAVVLGVACGGCGGGSSGRTSKTAALSSDTSVSSAASTSPRPPTTAPISSGGGSTASASGTTAGTVVPTTASGVTTTAAGATSATTAAATTTTRTASPTTTTVAPTTTTTTKGEVVLRVTGSSGTTEFSVADLKAMSYTEGWGGWKNQLGNITAPTLWRGVSVTALTQSVGGGSSIVVVASDGYEQPLSAAELGGAIAMYDPVGGGVVSSISGTLQAIVAYSENGAAIGTGQGPLRIAFVSPGKDQVTDGGIWVKWVVEIRVN
jgi:hypothetical protein